jgi:NAD(P)H-dependent nitrite reductase small subunit
VKRAPEADATKKRTTLPVVHTRWVDVAAVSEVPADGGVVVRYGAVQLAVYHFAARGEWYACQNACPHTDDMVLARGLLGDAAGEPKVACPMHKKTFSLASGACLSGEAYRIETFPVKIADGRVLLELPPIEALEGRHCPSASTCHADAAE